MSSWKKASKINQKPKLERHQPAARAHLGLLEKHKDYIPRARDYQGKRNLIKKLKEQALNRNPDEYYHHMVNSVLVDGKQHLKKKDDDENTVEQRKLLESKNLTYVRMKHVMERKKAQKLQAQLHFIDNPVSSKNQNSLIEHLSTQPNELPDSRLISKANKIKERNYKKLLKTMERAKKLDVIKNKMEMEQFISRSDKSNKPKLVIQGTKHNAPVYEWKYERKR